MTVDAAEKPAARERPSPGAGPAFLYGSAMLTLVIGSVVAGVLSARSVDTVRDAGLTVDAVTWTQAFLGPWLPWVILATVLFVGGYLSDILDQQRSREPTLMRP